MLIPNSELARQTEIVMTCYQCPKPAMYSVPPQGIPLCLDCYLKYTQINQANFENAERMLNYLHDSADAVVGLPPMGPRFPARPKPVTVQGVKMNNIRITDSVVGTVNTGSIGVVDQTISALGQAGDSQLAQAVKLLSEAVLNSKDLSPAQKKEAIEGLSVISSEAVAPKEQRRDTVALTLIERVSKITKLAGDVADVGTKWWPVLEGAFRAIAG